MPENANKIDPRLMTQAQTGRYLGVTQTTISKAIASGRLRVRVNVAGIALIHPDDAEDLRADWPGRTPPRGRIPRPKIGAAS